MQNNEAQYTKAIYTALRIGFIAILLYWSFLIHQTVYNAHIVGYYNFRCPVSSF